MKIENKRLLNKGQLKFIDILLKYVNDNTYIDKKDLEIELLSVKVELLENKDNYVEVEEWKKNII